MTRLDRAGFQELFSSWTTSVFRWECQGVYHEPDEAEPFQRWKDGDSDGAWLQPWCDRIRAWTAEGRSFDRVRMLTDPLTDYLQWMLALTHLNVGAGEDIRWMTEADARMFGAPDHDYYLFDDETLVILEFDEHGVSGAEIVDDPTAVEGARRWQLLAQANSIPHLEYLQRST